MVQRAFNYGVHMSLKSSANKIMCALSSRWRLIDAIERNDVAGVRQLLESGVDPNPSKRELKRWEDKTIRIPLFAALYCPTATILQLLLEYGANPHIQMHQYYKSRTVVPHRGLSCDALSKKRKSGVTHHKEYLINHLIGISVHARIGRLSNGSQCDEHFFDMYKLLRAHLTLNNEDQKLLNSHAHNGHYQAQLYLQWEEAGHQRQEILNNIKIPEAPQLKRKI